SAWSSAGSEESKARERSPPIPPTAAAHASRSGNADREARPSRSGRHSAAALPIRESADTAAVTVLGSENCNITLRDETAGAPRMVKKVVPYGWMRKTSLATSHGCS